MNWWKFWRESAQQMESPMQLTERAQYMLENGAPEGMPSDINPFIREDDATYLRYDALRIEHATDVFGGVNVCFLWKGVKTYTMRVEGPGMAGGATLNIGGIEGRMRVTRGEIGTIER